METSLQWKARPEIGAVASNKKTTWRIIPLSKWLITMVIVSPLRRVIPLPNGLGLLITYKSGMILQVRTKKRNLDLRCLKKYVTMTCVVQLGCCCTQSSWPHTTSRIQWPSQSMVDPWWHPVSRSKSPPLGDILNYVYWCLGTRSPTGPFSCLVQPGAGLVLPGSIRAWMKSSKHGPVVPAAREKFIVHALHFLSHFGVRCLGFVQPGFRGQIIAVRTCITGKFLPSFRHVFFFSCFFLGEHIFDFPPLPDPLPEASLWNSNAKSWQGPCLCEDIPRWGTSVPAAVEAPGVAILTVCSSWLHAAIASIWFDDEQSILPTRSSRYVYTCIIMYIYIYIYCLVRAFLC